MKETMKLKTAGYFNSLLIIGLLLVTLLPTPTSAKSKKAAQKKCPFQGEEHSHKPYPPLSACMWYNDNSCCEKEDTDRLIRKLYEARKGFQGSDECFERLVTLHCGLLCSPQQRHFLSNATASSTKESIMRPMDSINFDDEDEDSGKPAQTKAQVQTIHQPRIQPKFRYAICESHCKELFEICGESTIGFARAQHSWRTGPNWLSAEEFCTAQSLFEEVIIEVVKESFYTTKQKDSNNDDEGNQRETHVHNCFDGRAVEAVAANSFMYGPGIKGTTIGIKTFSIQAVDVFGDDVRDGHDHFRVLIAKEEDYSEEDNEVPVLSKTVTTLVTDHNNGMYTVDYNIDEPGTYHISVTLNGKHISNSPISLRFESASHHVCGFKGKDVAAVRPRNPFATCSWYNERTCCTEKEEKAIAKWLDVGIAPTFQSVPTCAAFFDALLCGFECSPRQGTFVGFKQKDGTHEFRICSTFCKQFYQACGGASVMGLTIKAIYSRHQDFCMANAPYQSVVVTVRDDHCFNGTNNEVSAKHSYVFGAQLQETTIAGKEASFKIKAMDMYGGEVKTGGETFDVAFQGPYLDHSPAVDNGDGTYSVHYRAGRAGSYTVYVSHDGADIASSPFMVKVVSSALDPTACIAYGYGLNLAIAGLPAYFFVLTTDEFRNPVSGGAARVTAQLTGPSYIVGEVREVAEGKYRVVYRAQVSGKYVLRVMVDGVHVPRSPFVVQVEPEGRTYASKCVVVGGGSRRGQVGRPTSFEIIAKDSYGNNKETGGDVFEVAMEGPDGRIRWGTVEDNGDGTYIASYILPSEGIYQLSITLLNQDDLALDRNPKTRKTETIGQHIQDSPMELWSDHQ